MASKKASGMTYGAAGGGQGGPHAAGGPAFLDQQTMNLMLQAEMLRTLCALCALRRKMDSDSESECDEGQTQQSQFKGVLRTRKRFKR